MDDARNDAVAIDFGTKSTMVAVLHDQQFEVKRVGMDGNTSSEENPTVMEDIEKKVREHFKLDGEDTAPEQEKTPAPETDIPSEDEE